MSDGALFTGDRVRCHESTKALKTLLTCADHCQGRGLTFPRQILGLPGPHARPHQGDPTSTRPSSISFSNRIGELQGEPWITWIQSHTSNETAPKWCCRGVRCEGSVGGGVVCAGKMRQNLARLRCDGRQVVPGAGSKVNPVRACVILCPLSHVWTSPPSQTFSSFPRQRSSPARHGRDIIATTLYLEGPSTVHEALCRSFLTFSLCSSVEASAGRTDSSSVASHVYLDTPPSLRFSIPSHHVRASQFLRPAALRSRSLHQL